MGDTRNIEIGACSVTYDERDMGYTQGGVSFEAKTDTHITNVDQFGQTTVDEIIMKRNVSVTVPLIETTLQNMLETTPGATFVTDGVKASGTVTLAANPTNNNTIIINGVTFTFRTTAALATEVTIGATAAATAANLAKVLNLSGNALVSVAKYSAASTVVTVTYADYGVVGNAFTLAAGTSGATVSGATLSGGVDITRARVDVATGTSISLLKNAKKLVLHPIDRLPTDRSKDIIVPLAGTGGNVSFSYQVDKERVYNITFMGYPDPTTGLLFQYGDETYLA
jgi:hypothetical protein